MRLVRIKGNPSLIKNREESGIRNKNKTRSKILITNYTVKHHLEFLVVSVHLLLLLLHLLLPSDHH